MLGLHAGIVICAHTCACDADDVLAVTKEAALLMYLRFPAPTQRCLLCMGQEHGGRECMNIAELCSFIRAECREPEAPQAWHLHPTQQRAQGSSRGLCSLPMLPSGPWHVHT